MKAVSLSFVLFYVATLFSQSNSQSLLDSAIRQFNREEKKRQETWEKPNYKPIVKLLNQVIKQKPEDAEANYYLAYAYSRINSSEGNGMKDMKSAMTIRTSDLLEKVIAVSRKYQGRKLLLDPYGKLTAEWGSQAFSFWYRNQKDSMIWALTEGKRRGGFSEYVIELSRKVLDECPPNAILMSSGDNTTFPLFYLQQVETYRKDVKLVDINLLSSSWYPSLLRRDQMADFDMPAAMLDTIGYIQWKDSSVSIGGFTWKVKGGAYGRYMVRGDLVFLSLLKKDEFKHTLCFVNGYRDEDMLSLSAYLNRGVLIQTFNKGLAEPKPYEEYRSLMAAALNVNGLLNTASAEDLGALDVQRYYFLMNIAHLVREGDKGKAAELLNLLDQKADVERYPYQLRYLQNLDQAVRDLLK